MDSQEKNAFTSLIIEMAKLWFEEQVSWLWRSKKFKVIKLFYTRAEKVFCSLHLDASNYQVLWWYGASNAAASQENPKLFCPVPLCLSKQTVFSYLYCREYSVATTALPSIWSQFQMIPTNYWINLHPMIFIIFSSFSPVGEENILTIPHYFKSWETGAEREKLVVALVMGRIPFVENYDSWPLVIHRLHFPCTTTPHYSPHFVSF